MPSCHRHDHSLATSLSESPRTVQRGPSVGRYQDRPIADWIRDDQGVIWDYVRAVDPHCVELDSLADDEAVIAPGLVYKQRPLLTENNA